MGDELRYSTASACLLSHCDTPADPFRNIIVVRPQPPGVVLPILQLVEQAHFDGAFEGPIQIVVIVSSHQIGAHRHMSARLPIGIHPETHLVPSKVRVHRITEPHFILLFLLLKSSYLDNPWWAGVASGCILEPTTQGEGNVRCAPV